MKKKLLFCIHNYFFLKHYILDLKQLEKYFEITIITSNYLVTDQNYEYKKLNEETNIKNIYFVPFYKEEMQRSLYSIFLTHLFLIRLKKKINFKKFDTCITDSKFFIWERIIIDNFLYKKCRLIGVATSSMPLDLSVFKKVLEGESIDNFVNKLHKLRQYKIGNRVKEKKFYLKLKNIKNRYLDIIVDRKILSYIFYFRNFNYKKYDLNIMETDNFDYKIIFHYANYLFWKKLYKKKDNVILAVHENSCSCENKNKDKILFISSSWQESKEKISDQIDKIINFLKIKTSEYPLINEFHVKHHPMESNQKINFINDLFIEKIGKTIKLRFIDKEHSLNEIACDYQISYGMMSTALSDVKKACNKNKVYCLKSINVDEFGDDYFLKLLNEDIIFYDDIKNEVDKNANQYDKYIQNVNKVKFSNFIKDIIV